VAKLALLLIHVVVGEAWRVDMGELLDGLEFSNIPYLW